MKARVFSHKTPSDLAEQLDAFAGEAVTIRHVGYSIAPNGTHHALVVFSPGADRRDGVVPAAHKFIADALESNG